MGASSRSGFWWPAALVLLMLISGGCIRLIKPLRSFEHYTPPPAPDYSRPESWATLPTRADSADAVPLNSGLRSRQASAPADVFFLHLTTRVRPRGWNTDIANRHVNRYTDRYSIRTQASVFNAAGRVYAPRYRQATLYSFFDSTANSRQALALAYADVKSAFEYYLAHYNQGRPIIIAAHSQGTYHARRLLREFFDRDPALRRRLVAAYLVGLNVDTLGYRALRPCRDSLQTGCYVSWNTGSWGHDYPPYDGALVTNPLTWRVDTAYAPARLNRGSVPLSFKRLDQPGVADAQVHQGILWTHPSGRRGYFRFPLPGKWELRHSYHLNDYGLYYLSVRRNARARLRAWQRANP
ncbi:DUF3089 domain-containing protein [Hymenobacter jeollabukensis]|uniref:DUF3089 domain-containing protein n=1 Tax=Hymenobacter jeollabukensis TaxID=2025313 RepID=A0A5R8WMC0_9BACT|nr:DUF3089 domain-containing protein [Hymenobacter jeollabukensis]TLM90566.1 DUF3089 domain-containing protein [Hymenobacter jeollabukensis]